MSLDITYWIEHSGLPPEQFMNQLFSATCLFSAEVIDSTGDPEYPIFASCQDEVGEIQMLIRRIPEEEILAANAEFLQELEDNVEDNGDLQGDDLDKYPAEEITLRELVDKFPEFLDLEIVVLDNNTGDYVNPFLYVSQWFCDDCESDDCEHNPVLVLDIER